MKPFTPKRSSGAAALLFLLIFPALFAVYVWGLEGARMMQASARLTDATESAALAVASNKVVTNETCNAISKGMIEAYFVNASGVKVADQAAEGALPCVIAGQSTFTISAAVEEATWFPSAPIINLGNSFTVSDSVKVERDLMEPMDIVLAANFSGSMVANEEAMKSYMVSVIDKVAALNTPTVNNRVALVGYDHLISRRSPEGEKEFDHNLICTNNSQSNNAKDCNKQTGNNKSQILDYLNASKIHKEKTIENIFGVIDLSEVDQSDNSGGGSRTCTGSSFSLFWFLSWEVNTCNDVDASAQCSTTEFTILWWTITSSNCEDNDEEIECKRQDYSWWEWILWARYQCTSSGNNGNQNNNQTVELVSKAHYETIRFGSQLGDIAAALKGDEVFKAEKTAKDEGSYYGSASYTALIEAARLLAFSGVNPNRKIIFFTDGKEENTDIAYDLIYDTHSQAGACSTIINYINGLTTKDDKPVSLEIYIVGFGYDSTKGAALQECAQATKDPNSDIATYSEVSNEYLDQILTTNFKNVGRLIN